MTHAERLRAAAERLYGKPRPARPGHTTEADRRRLAAERKASGKLLTKPLSDRDRRDWAEVVGWFGKGGAA